MPPLSERLAITINGIAESSAKGSQASIAALQMLAEILLTELKTLEAQHNTPLSTASPQP